MRCFAFILGVSLALGPALVPRLASAAPPAAGSESDDDRKAAAKAFGEGQKAYNAGDYRHAAESFEEAYKRAPRLPPLWNAARAWHKARELVRAANLYSKYLKLAPPNAPDRNSATSAMRELEPKLGRLEIHAPSFDGVTLDGAPVEEFDDQGQAIVYVTPGSHLVEGTLHGKPAKKTSDVPAGTSSSVVLVVEDSPPPPPKNEPPPPPVEEKSHGWSPIVVAVGGGLTAVGVGLVIWSGLDTLSQRQTFDQSPTQANLDDGRGRQTRTNVIIGVTAGVAALTTAAAIFLVDWKGHKKTDEAPAGPTAKLGVGIGSLTLAGTF